MSTATAHAANSRGWVKQPQTDILKPRGSIKEDSGVALKTKAAGVASDGAVGVFGRV